MVHFASKGHDVFACIRGNLTVESRKEVIDKYWSNPVEAWFEKGKDDPSLLMLRFELIDAEVWDADPSLKGMFKMLTGKTVKPEEMGSIQRFCERFSSSILRPEQIAIADCFYPENPCISCQKVVTDSITRPEMKQRKESRL